MQKPTPRRTWKALDGRSQGSAFLSALILKMPYQRPTFNNYLFEKRKGTNTQTYLGPGKGKLCKLLSAQNTDLHK